MKSFVPPEITHLLAIDLETTGLDPMRHEIIEIGAVLLDKNLHTLGEFSSLVKPDHPERAISGNFNAFSYANINPRDAAQAPTLGEAIRGIMSLVGDIPTKQIVLFGQNTQFDRGFLVAAFRKLEKPWPFGIYSLGLESAWMLHNLRERGAIPGQLSLKAIGERAGITNPQAHSALADIRTTVRLLKWLVDD